MFKQYRSYKSPKGTPACVKFWDRKFSKLNFWWDWLALRTIVENEISTIMQACQLPKAEATRVAWSAFCLVQENDNPLKAAFLKFKNNLSPKEQALFLTYLAIGTLIHQGKEENEAIKEVRKIMQEDLKPKKKKKEKPASHFKVVHYYLSIKEASENLSCVKYWNEQFQDLCFWDDFVILKRAIEKRAYKLILKDDISPQEAVQLSWISYIDAVLGAESSVITEYTLLVQHISDAELPLYLAHTTIGTDIFDGASEQDAQQQYLTWLTDNPKNPIFGEYLLRQDFTVARRPRVRSNEHARKKK